MAKTKKQLEAENRELREENRQLREENRELRELVAELRKRIQDLEAEVKQLKKRRFAPKSERNRTNADPLNGLVGRLTGDFPEDERQRVQELVDLLRTTRDEHRQLMERLKAEGKLKPKAPRNRGGWIPEDLPVRHEYVSVERRCPCGCQRDLVSTQQSERLGYVPGYFERVVTSQPVYRCPACDTFSTPTPLHEPSICGFADASLLAQVVLWKIDDHLPIHRIARLLGRDGVPVPKGTVLGWFFQAATWLEGVAEAVRKQALASGVVYVDDTPITVMDKTREKGSYKGRIWTVCGGRGQIYYRFSEDWKQKHPLALLQGFEGTIVGDGYGGYGGIVKTLKITLAGCSAHARRKFWDLLEREPSLAVAQLGFETYQRLYDVEREAKVRGLTAEERRALRQRKSKPILERFYALIEPLQDRLRPKDPQRRAIGYAVKQKAELCAFLEDGRIELDNTRAERALRRIAVGRKNWEFAGSVKGAHAIAVLGTLIESCRDLGVPVREYLIDVLRRVRGVPASEVVGLTPEGWWKARQAAAGG